MLTERKILIIDDSTTMRNFLRTLFTQRGAVVSEAANGTAALEWCAEGQTCDLILLDLMLPDINGLEVLQLIRDKYVEPAVVVITGSGDIRTATLAVHRGADGYVTKQDLRLDNDQSGFFFVLEQAMNHRAGVLAQKQLEKVKSDFYAMVTHDLRNPASVIATVARIMHSDPRLEHDQVEMVELIDAGVDKMLNLINNYLDYASIDQGYLRLDLQTADMREVVHASVPAATVQARVKAQIVTFDVPAEPVMAIIDAPRLTQVLDNLISNAVKYTPAKGHIGVRLYREADTAVIAVSDTGDGITPAAAEQLFTKYHRLHGHATHGVRGTGLGLLIVKEIVHAHGGRVWAESTGTPGEGTTFYICIPLGTA